MNERLFYGTAALIFGAFFLLVWVVLKSDNDSSKYYSSLAVRPDYDAVAGGNRPSSLKGIVREKKSENTPLNPVLGPAPLPELESGDAAQQEPVGDVPGPLHGLLIDQLNSQGQQQELPQVVVAMNHSPPRKIVEKDRVGGFDVALLKEFASRAQVSLTYRICTFDECVEALQNGDVDLMTGISPSGQRRQSLSFLHPQVPFPTAVGFFTRSESKLRIDSYQDLSGKKVGHLRGYEYFAQFDRDQTIDKTEFETIEELISALLDNKVDVVIGDDSRIAYQLRLEGLTGQVRQAEFAVTENPMLYFLVVSKKSALQKVRKEWEQILAQMILEGQVETTLQQFKDRIVTAVEPEQRSSD